MIELLIVAPIEKLRHQVPRGFGFTDEVFSEARLKDPISDAQRLTAELQRALTYLANRYPRRIHSRWVELWSPGGLWCALRFRLRSFPAIVLNQKEVIIGENLEFHALIEYIPSILSQPQE
ncbi:MAG: hypothetical protein PVI99_04280 [Anaerolineales bacterium]|jgi:hypothetical protein